jgi:hypothetical protein
VTLALHFNDVKQLAKMSLRTARNALSAVSEKSERYIDAKTEAGTGLVQVVEYPVVTILLKFPVFGAGQVARFKLQFYFLAADFDSLASDKIKFEARALDYVRLSGSTAAGDAFGSIVQQQCLC